MNFITKFFAAIVGFFHKPAVEQAFTEVAQLVPLASPIVADIAALTPNRTVTEIATAYAKYGVPLAATISSGADSTTIENALFNLASTVLLKNLGNGAALNLVNTAVQVAFTAFKAAA